MAEKKSAREQRLRRMLLEKKRRMWLELREELFQKLGREYNEQFDNPHDVEELGLIDLIEDTGLALTDIKRDELTRMDETVRKLEDGTYGRCEDCGQDIDEGRLRLIPTAIYCTTCQEKRETHKPTL